MKEPNPVMLSVRNCLKSPRHSDLILLAVIVGGGITLITYPGIWYSDSYARADCARLLAEIPWKEIPKGSIESYLSLLPQFVIAFCLECTRNYAFYTWMQASFFLWSVLSFVCHFFDGIWRLLVGALLLASPLILGYAVYWEMGVVSAACLLWLLILEDKLEGPGQVPARPLRYVLWLLYGVAVFFMVGYRLNAGTAAVGLLVWGAVHHIWRRDKSLRGWLPQLLAVGLGVISAFGLPGWLGVQGRSNGVVGFAWESACMLSEIGEGQGYDTFLDPVLGEGATKAIMAVPPETGRASMYAYQEGAGVSLVAHFRLAEPEARKSLYKCFLQLVRSHPRLYLSIKSGMIWSNLRELGFVEYNYDRWDRMEIYRFSDTLRREQFYQAVIDYMAANKWLRTPWLLFAVSTVLGALQFAAGGSRMPFKLLWTAFCYEGAFFITSQNFEFRYFFPACLLLLFACLLSLQTLALTAWRFLRANGAVIGRHGFTIK